MRQAYQKEIAKIEGEEIDYAFFPLDSRQGEESVLGINYFMQLRIQRLYSQCICGGMTF